MKVIMKKTLSFIISFQIMGLGALLSTQAVANQNDNPIPPRITSDSGYRKDSEPEPIPRVCNCATCPCSSTTSTHTPTTRTEKSKAGFSCKKEDGKWKTGCIIAGALLVVGAIVGIALLLGKRKGKGGGSKGGGEKRGGGEKGGETKKTEEKSTESTSTSTSTNTNTETVGCCKAAPTPAPTGGGTTQTSTTTSTESNTPPSSGTTVQVN